MGGERRTEEGRRDGTERERVRREMDEEKGRERWEERGREI